MFCPKCGSLLLPKKDDGKKILACSCGYKNKEIEETRITDSKKLDRKIEIVDIDQTENKVLPLVDIPCPKCPNGKAYFWMVQTRASDEPETKFYKCSKCKHVWRDYS